MIESLYSWLLIGCFAAWFAMIPVAFLVGVFFLLRFARQRTLRIHEVWKAFAQANGLAFDSGSLFVYPKITGTYRNRPVAITILVTPRGTSGSRYYTVATTPIKAPPATQVEVVDRNQTGLYFQTQDSQTISVGDERFASKFGVKGNSEAFARAMLSPTNQLAILESGISHLRVKESTLTARYRGFDHGPEVLSALLNVVSEVATTTEKDSREV